MQDVVTSLFTDVPRPAALRDTVEQATDTRFLLVAAGEVRRVAAATYIESAAPSRVDVWTVEGAGHTGGLATAPDEWESRVTGFLDDALLGDAQG